MWASQIRIFTILQHTVNMYVGIYVFMRVHNVKVPTIYTTKEHIYSSKIQHVLTSHQYPTT